MLRFCYARDLVPDVEFMALGFRSLHACYNPSARPPTLPIGFIVVLFGDYLMGF